MKILKNAVKCMRRKTVSLLSHHLSWYISYFYSSSGLEIPDAFRVSGRVTHKGIIIGRKRMYVTLSRHESGQDKSRG